MPNYADHGERSNHFWQQQIHVGLTPFQNFNSKNQFSLQCLETVWKKNIAWIDFEHYLSLVNVVNVFVCNKLKNLFDNNHKIPRNLSCKGTLGAWSWVRHEGGDNRLSISYSDWGVLIIHMDPRFWWPIRAKRSPLLFSCAVVIVIQKKKCAPQPPSITWHLILSFLLNLDLNVVEV